MAAPGSRIVALDVLRGAGILGILLTHIQMFAMPLAARSNPTVFGHLAGADRAVWAATFALADGKFIVIFAMLFGAGLVIQAETAARAGVSAARLHYRRMAALLAIGVAHAYLLWYGDMLVTFALCGALVFVHRHLSSARLLLLGLAALAVPPLLSSVVALADPGLVAAAAGQAAPDVIAREISAYRGGWLQQQAHRVPTAWQAQTSYFALRGAWQTSGLMLLGMAFYRVRLLTGQRPARWYVALAVGGFGIGLVLVWLAAQRGFAHGWDLGDQVRVGIHLTSWANLLVGLGWTGLLLLWHRTGRVPAAVVAAGRTALSNYLLATLACTTLFYGHGLALFGSVDRLGQLLVVVGVWTVQLTASRAWLRRAALGPVEWVVRRVVYGRAIPVGLTAAERPT